MENETIHHESFAQISFRRTNGSTNFYGSELQQSNYITMEVKESYMERSLTDDKYYTKKPILKLRMSSAQFAELITSLNVGNGVPCTLERVGMQPVPSMEHNENRKTFVHRKFKERMVTYANSLLNFKNVAKKIINKKILSKEDQSLLNLNIDSMVTEINSNIPFFAECFQETMDQVVFEAKTEAENSILHKITSLGLEKLNEINNNNKLIDGFGKENEKG